MSVRVGRPPVRWESFGPFRRGSGSVRALFCARRLQSPGDATRPLRRRRETARGASRGNHSQGGTCALAPRGGRHGVTYARAQGPPLASRVCRRRFWGSKSERCVRNANSRGDGDPTRRRGRSPKGRQLRLCRCATSRAVALGYEEPFPPDPGARCTLTRGQRMKKKRVGIVGVNATRRGPGRHIEKDA